MISVLHVIWHGVRDSLLMAYAVGWALGLGFAISGVVQVWVPRERVRAALGDGGARAVGRATALGAASSSCSYAAVAIGRSLMEKGASLVTALAFQFASTNLVWELGLVLWALVGWQFAVAEYLGGLVMIALMALGARWFVSRAVQSEARARLSADADAGAPAGHCHHHDHPDGDAPPGAATSTLRHRLTSPDSWREVANAVLADWRMLWREILSGFVLAGFIAQVPDRAFRALLVTRAPAPLPALENAVVGPLIAVLSFVCSIGNVPLAAVLWSGGIGFAGVLAFLFADLLVLPIIAFYGRTYGRRFTVRIVALMYVTMVLAALLVATLFHGLHWIPEGHRPSRADVFSSVRLDHTFALNGVALFLLGGMVALTRGPRIRSAAATAAAPARG